MFTTFFDRCSGGSTKVDDYDLIIIEGGEHEAVAIFEQRFGRDPYNTTCECCGSDYCVHVNDTVEEARKSYERYKTLVINKGE